jgi:hypothetical protein
VASQRCCCEEPQDPGPAKVSVVSDFLLQSEKRDFFLLFFSVLASVIPLII